MAGQSFAATKHSMLSFLRGCSSVERLTPRVLRGGVGVSLPLC